MSRKSAKRPAPKPNKALTFDEIVAADDCPLQPLTVPEWGGDIYLQPLSGDRMVEAADNASKGAGEMTNAEYLAYLCELCGQCIVDENGNKIFEGKKAEFLTGKNFSVTQRIGTQICEMNGLNAKGIEEKKSD